ncbi:MAG: TetR family transcriptional regulator [Sphingomonas bacterium]|jgi:AcrR family transcriptional regulator|nr:TetR/AcrR family transcriptional regulator [Sphingomonas bacterium]MDB5688508.1 TetR family transcriptional regulator [Sphingomonas bacterium]
MKVPAPYSATKGRPREFDCERALAQALRVFWLRGYEGASMTELTSEMGITKPSLYAAFGNKESLFKKALDLYERDKMAYVADALAAPTCRQVAEILLRGAVDMTTSTCDPRGCLGVISSVACGAEAESIREEVKRRRSSSTQALIDRFARAKREGELPDGVEPDALARYLLAILQGLALQAGNGAARDELAQLVDTTLSMWPCR